MGPLFKHVYEEVAKLLEGCREVDGVYAVSMWVQDIDDDPRRPTVTLGYNTETQVVEQASRAYDESEARWNFAFWLQNEVYVIGGDHYPESAALRDSWVSSTGFAFPDELWDVDPDRCEVLCAALIQAFVSGLVEVVRELHQDGLVRDALGEGVPILIHELEYHDGIADLNARANPEASVRAFVEWIRDS